MLSYIEPHQPVTTQPVSRCIVEVLTMSGVDTSTFIAHSTRAASTSKAKTKGICIRISYIRISWKEDIGQDNRPFKNFTFAVLKIHKEYQASIFFSTWLLREVEGRVGLQF